MSQGVLVKVTDKFLGDDDELAEELAVLCARKETKWGFDANAISSYFEESNYFLELVRGTERIGFLLMGMFDYGPPKIVLVCVSKAQTGKGLSKLLIDKAKELAKAAGKKEIVLEAENSKVAEVYTAQGFKATKGMTMSAKLGGRRRTLRRRRRTLSRRR